MNFAVALNLNAKDAEVLLSSAGYSFMLEDVITVIGKAINILENLDFLKKLSELSDN